MKTAKPLSEAAGFTLVEVLVALVITGLLVAVLISSLYYMFRAQDMVRSETIEREADLRAKAWFTDVLAHCLPMEQKSSSAFSGRAREIRCETTAALEPRQYPVPMRIVLTLTEARDVKSQMTYAELGQRKGQEASKPRPIAAWPDNEASFIFFDSAGRQSNRWPPEKAEYQALPALIALVVKRSGGDIFWLAAPRADGWLIPPPLNPFGIPIPGT